MLPRLAFRLVRSRAGITIAAYWHDLGFDDENAARKSWARDYMLSDYVDYTNFENKLRKFLKAKPSS